MLLVTAAGLLLAKETRYFECKIVTSVTQDDPEIDVHNMLTNSLNYIFGLANLNRSDAMIEVYTPYGFAPLAISFIGNHGELADYMGVIIARNGTIILPVFETEPWKIDIDHMKEVSSYA